MITVYPPATPIDADITLPGSKSYTNRALIIASIAGGESTLLNASPSNDSIAMKEALEKLGVQIQVAGDSWKVQVSNSGLDAFKGTIDVGPAGTTMRFLCALIASIPGANVRLQGSERMHQRPINDLVNALRELGGSIEYLGNPNCPPLLIKGKQLKAGAAISIDGSKSSQYITALSMIAPRIGGLTINVTGSLVSKTYIEMAIDTMRAFGAVINASSDMCSLEISATHYRPQRYEIEADASGASYFWGLAAVNQGRVRINGVNPNSVQGDMRFPHLLAEMGCRKLSGDNWIEISNESQLKGISCDMTLMPDTAQTLAVIAATAKGETRITGLSTLKIKETDRLLALQQELAKCGIDSTVDDQSITVTGGTPHFAEIATYDDHRMAMSFALLGARKNGVAIHEPRVVEKSFPDFWERLKALNFKVDGSI